MTSAPTGEAASQPASIFSDSVTYCGRFPAMDSSHYRQCGEARRRYRQTAPTRGLHSVNKQALSTVDQIHIL